MRYFLDTEFMESGPRDPIRLISIGIAAEDGRTYYAEDASAPLDKANPWVRQNVIPFLWGPRKERHEIRSDIAMFVADPAPEFWGYFADYDWVVFCQLFGSMVDLPRHFPQFCMDLQQVAAMRGVPRESFVPAKAEREHDALADAVWHRDLYRFLVGGA
jgi:hypothetical protein